ncbi:MAG: hypothetical protein AAF716_17660 [Cyanobacteria bacterium P01_D01_bin.1]
MSVVLYICDTINKACSQRHSQKTTLEDEATNTEKSKANEDSCRLASLAALPDSF